MTNLEKLNRLNKKGLIIKKLSFNTYYISDIDRTIFSASQFLEFKDNLYSFKKAIQILKK